MLVVCKHRQRSLRFNVPLLIVTLSLILFQVIPLTVSSSKRHIRRMDHSGKERYRHSISLNQSYKFEKSKISTIKTTTIVPRYPSIRVQTRTSAVLPCNISEILETENSSLSWAKQMDSGEFLKIGTLNRLVGDNNTDPKWTWNEDYWKDRRFIAKLNEMDWSLHIRYTSSSDAGIYQCQICHDLPPTRCSTRNVTLRLVDARAKIIGGPNKFIPSDKELPLRLSCVLIKSIVPPSYIFWYHYDRMINYDLEDGATVRKGPQGSELIFPKPNKTHVGNYSCVPSNAQLDYVMVYYGDENLGQRSCADYLHPAFYIIIHFIAFNKVSCLLY